MEFAQKCSIGDMQVVAYAYRPILKLSENMNDTTLLDGDMVYLELSDPMDDVPLNSSTSNDAGRTSPSNMKTYNPSLSFTTQVTTDFKNVVHRPSTSSFDQQTQSTVSRSKDNSNGHQSMIKPKPLTARLWSQVDCIDAGVVMDKSRFYRELIKGQTFLGMAAMSYQPKAVEYRDCFAIN